MTRVHFQRARLADVICTESKVNDISTIAAVLTSIKTASEIATAIKSSVNSLEQAEVNFKIAELVGSLADAKMQIADIQNEILDKDSRIGDLQKRLQIKDSVIWEKPYYWIMKDEEKTGPFCQHCYDTESKLIRLQGGGTDPWRCQACKNTVTDKNYVVKPSRTYY